MEKRKKNGAIACLREGYPLDISESLRDIPLPFFFFFSTDIPRNIPRLARGFNLLSCQ